MAVKSTVNIFMNSVENMMLKSFGNHFIKLGFSRPPQKVNKP